MTMSERQQLTVVQAVSMLPVCEYVHTFRGGRGVMVGADWKRSDVVAHITEHGAELAGENATRMGHGIVILEPDGGALFVETQAVQP